MSVASACRRAQAQTAGTRSSMPSARICRFAARSLGRPRRRMVQRLLFRRAGACREIHAPVRRREINEGKAATGRVGRSSPGFLYRHRLRSCSFVLRLFRNQNPAQVRARRGTECARRAVHYCLRKGSLPAGPRPAPRSRFPDQFFSREIFWIERVKVIDRDQAVDRKVDHGIRNTSRVAVTSIG